MTPEIELKLAVTPNFVELLTQSLTNFHILQHKTVFLGNCYYDNANLQLAACKIGLRVRKENENFTLTLKTDGEVKGGLHIRPEYNLSLENADFGEVQLAALAEQSGISLSQFMPFQIIFSTDFERQFWLVECGNGAVIEVAFDQGEILAGKNKQAICEVEFELKQGKIQDLLFFVKGLILEKAIRLSSASKAQRGYALANFEIKEIDWLVEWEFVLQKISTDSKYLQHLLQFEQNLIEDTFSLGQSYLGADFSRCVARISAFFNLYSYFQENQSLLHRICLQNSNFDESIFIELLDSNQWLLEQIKNIMYTHSQTKNHQQAIGQLCQLLETGEYVKRMLNLLQLGL
ncbi:CYTH domain-containing protein [[Haemophilus] felis]|nr:CYTH domain-containing protein [[Haemophilus] felis]